MQCMEGERRGLSRSADRGVRESLPPAAPPLARPFALRGARVEPLTSEGEATVRLLKLNLDKRVVERQLLMAAGRYPR